MEIALANGSWAQKTRKLTRTQIGELLGLKGKKGLLKHVPVDLYVEKNVGSLLVIHVVEGTIRKFVQTIIQNQSKHTPRPKVNGTLRTASDRTMSMGYKEFQEASFPNISHTGTLLQNAWAYVRRQNPDWFTYDRARNEYVEDILVGCENIWLQ